MLNQIHVQEKNVVIKVRWTLGMNIGQIYMNFTVLILYAKTNPKIYESIMLENTNGLDWKNIVYLYLQKAIQIPVIKLRSASFQRAEADNTYQNQFNN